MKEQTIYRILVSACCLVLLTACVNTRKATYFNDIADTATIAATAVPEPII